MNRTSVWVFVVCAALCVPGIARSRVYYGFSVGTAHAPRAPFIRVVGEPHALLANDAMVYVIDDPAVRFDGDMFRYGQYWFAYTHGFWYRARSPRGPYAVIDVLKVPRAIIGVPRKLWKHHPLAQAPGRAVAASSVASRVPGRTVTASFAATAAPRISPLPRRDSVRGKPKQAAPSAISGRAASGTRRTRRESAR